MSWLAALLDWPISQMDVHTLKSLLANGEKINVEFKSQIDLKSKYGRAKFIKEMLALVNTHVSPAYLIVGVDDATGKPIGYEGITEEQLQQVIDTNCKPAIYFSFHTVAVNGVNLGVITIPRSTNKPHTTNAELGFQNSKGKQGEISNKQVFIRRGTTVTEATPDEIVDMAQDVDTQTEQLEKISHELNSIGHELRDIGHSVDYADGQIPGFFDPIVDTTTAGLTAGGVAGLFVGLEWTNGFGGIIVSILTLLLIRTIKLNDFGVTKIITLGVFVGLVTTTWFLFAANHWLEALFSHMISTRTPVTETIQGLIVGTLSGFIFGWLEHRAKY